MKIKSIFYNISINVNAHLKQVKNNKWNINIWKNIKDTSY